MYRLMRICYDPKEEENDGGTPDNQAEIDALEQALLDEGGEGGKKSEEKEVESTDKDADKDIKGKGKSVDKAVSEDDPEYEIENGKDDKGNPIKVKAKLSELKAGYLRQDDYTKKTQRLSEVEKNQKDMIATVEAIRQNPKLAKLFIGIVEGAISEKGYNEEFIEKQLTALAGVQAEPGDKKKDLQDKNEDIEKILEDVDPESPLAKALKQTWAANKALETRLKGLEEGHSKTSKTVEEQITKEQETAYNKLVDGAAKIMNDTLDGLADPEKGSKLDFVSKEEQQEWRYRVVAYLKDNPKDYKDDTEFVTRLNEVGNAVHKYIKQYRESLIAQKLDANKKKKVIEKEPENNQSAEALTLEQEILTELENIGS